MVIGTTSDADDVEAELVEVLPAELEADASARSRSAAAAACA